MVKAAIPHKSRSEVCLQPARWWAASSTSTIPAQAGSPAARYSAGWPGAVPRATQPSRAARNPLCVRPPERWKPQILDQPYKFAPEDHCNECTHHHRSEEHTSELQSLMRISYDVFCLKK